MRRATRNLVLALALLPGMVEAQDDSKQLGNWFNDPFFQVRSSFADCPTPLGPFITREAARRQEHYRVERGTSCYLSGECKKPNAYFYDADIAMAIEAIFTAHPTLVEHSALWITVSRRFVYVEGCSKEKGEVKQLQLMLGDLPEVQAILLNITDHLDTPVPYRTQPKAGLTPVP